MKRAHPEHSLQRAVVRMLPRVLHPDVFWSAINPLPGRSPQAGAQAKQLGVRAGVPDLLFVRKGRTLWIELKAPGKSATRSQRSVHYEMVEAYRNGDGTWSGDVLVCPSIDHVLRGLASFELTVKRTRAA